ncbi:MAG: hypothetical protein O7A04_10770 [Acidobacteria bacterium]|nr:hypothetical protein [Acidobacteriota bacterium]
MPRRCTICTHPEHHAIEKALVSGETYRAIARTYRVGTSSLWRHKKEHLPAQLLKAREAEEVDHAIDVVKQIKAREAEEVGHAIDIVKQLKAINAASLEVLQNARASKRDSTLLRAVDRIHRQIELQARLLGDLQDQQTVNVAVVMDPQWLAIRSTLLRTLSPHPEARTAVVSALREIEA